MRVFKQTHDNDVVMDGCYTHTHKQESEEPRLVGGQWQVAGVGRGGVEEGTPGKEQNGEPFPSY